MALYQPVVRATIVDIKADRPQAGDRFLIDTNAWYWLTYSRSQNTSRPPQSYQVQQYPGYIEAALKATSELLWSGLSMAELTTLIERSEYDIFCRTNQLDPQNFSIKAYRHGHLQERANQVVAEINAAWGLVETFGKCLESSINQAVVTQTIADFSRQALDGYDSLIIHAAQTANIDQIITDDIDFVTVPDITVFTANRNALSAAKSQNRLLTR
jgi:predicted nucleic acid-binding protein